MATTNGHDFTYLLSLLLLCEWHSPSPGFQDRLANGLVVPPKTFALAYTSKEHRSMQATA